MLPVRSSDVLAFRNWDKMVEPKLEKYARFPALFLLLVLIASSLCVCRMIMNDLRRSKLMDRQNREALLRNTTLVLAFFCQHTNTKYQQGMHDVLYRPQSCFRSREFS